MVRRVSVAAWPIARLTALVDDNPHDPEILRAVLAELRQRETPEAASLTRRIHALLSRVEGVASVRSTSDVGEHSDQDDSVEDMLGVLRGRLAIAEQRARDAEARARDAEARAAAAERRVLDAELFHAAPTSLYAKVHLAPTAPSWLVQAAQRAFRLRYHPDLYDTVAMRKQAETIFKEAESIFAQIREKGREAAA